MKVSIVVPTYSMERYNDFTECMGALISQTYNNIEMIVIIDGNDEVYDRAVADFGQLDNVVIYKTHRDAGPLSRANMGAIQASGELVALTDDDAVPREDWVAQLVDTYQRNNAIAVGGRIEPEWVAGEIEFLPEEFYFLIGVTHRGFANQEQEVRNTFGANIAFKREVYMKLGGIKQGGIDPSQVQGRETEFCARMYNAYGEGVIYNPEAVVSHKIYRYRTRAIWLVKRAFWQGYSKRAMEKLVPDSSSEESDQLRRLLVEFIPDRIRGILARPSKVKVNQLATLLFLLAAIGIGYFYGILRWR